MKKIKSLMMIFAGFLLVFTPEVKAEEAYSEAYKKLTTDGTITLTTSTVASKTELVNSYISHFNQVNQIEYNSTDSFSIQVCGDSGSTCIISRTDTSGNTEQHEIQIIYKEEYSELFKKATSNGIINIKSTNLYSDNNIAEKRRILTWDYLTPISDNAHTFELEFCNDDYTECDLLVVEDTIGLERHKVTFTYNEEFSEDFALLMKDGPITITNSGFDTRELVKDYITAYNKKNGTNFVVSDYNNEMTACTVSTNNEQHVVKLIFSEVYSKQFQALTSDGKLNITNSSLTDSKDTLIQNYINEVNKKSNGFAIKECNDNTSACLVTYTNSAGEVEQHRINITYKEEFSEDFKKLSFISSMSSTAYNASAAISLIDSSSDSTDNLIKSYIEKFNKENQTKLSVEKCNDDYSICTIVNNNAGDHVEKHNVVIKKYSEEFKKFIPNGIIKITDSSLETNKYYAVLEAVNKYNTNSSMSTAVYSCNEDYSLCEIGLSSNNTSEFHTVKILFEEEYGEVFKNAIPNGELVIKSTTIEENKGSLIYSALRNFDSEEYKFSYSQCNDDASICTVILSTTANNTYAQVERHTVKIRYQEEYSEQFKKYISGKQFVINSIKPSSPEEAYFFLSGYIGQYSKDGYYFDAGACNNDYSICDIILYDTNGGYESHIVNVTYSDEKIDKQILEKANQLLNALPKGKRFLIEDLELINYIYNSSYSNADEATLENIVINYSSELKQYLGNLSAKLDVRAGWAGPFTSGCFGGFLVLYNDAIYGLLKDGGAQKNYVLYIPDDTENTKEAFIEAAQSRINEYLNNEEVTVRYGGKLRDYLGREVYDDDIEFISDSFGKDISRVEDYYIITSNDKEYAIILMKDSSSMQEIAAYENNDIVSGIVISSTSSNIPLDTVVQVNEITKDSTLYNEVINTLKVQDALIYDLKLYSSTKSEYISVLDDGTFTVKVPLPESMLNKDLVAYYIHDNGYIEEHEITIVDGMALFNTDHFSIYTIAEKRLFNEEVPNTYDGIMTYIVLGIISLIGLIGSMVYAKKKSNVK